MALLKTAAEIFRRYVTAGVPASGPNPVVKDDVIAWGTFLETMLNAGVSGVGLAYATRSALNANLVPGANSTAIVYNDSTAAYNGFYVKSGGSGSGSWSRFADLPGAIVQLTVTGGTANAIVATAPETPLLPGNKLFLLTPTANNTDATTLNYNSQGALPVRSAFGTDLVGGELLIDSPVLMLGASDHFTLLLSTNVDADGILASAQAAQAAAADSASDAADSATLAEGYAAAASPITRPAYGPVASPWPYFLGDSLFTNGHASPTLPALIQAAKGWSSIVTDAVSGATIADQASIYGFQRSPSIANPTGIWLGTNDCILDSSENRVTERTSLEGLRALIWHFAIPTSKRVTGQAMTTAAGTWSNISSAIDPNGSATNSAGAVKRGTVTGRHVVVGGWCNTGTDGLLAVSIGNGNGSSNLVETNFALKRSAILTNSPGGSPTTTVPFVRIYKNVGIDDDSKLNVSVANVSSGGAGKEIFISYVAGLSGKQDEAMPLVAVSNLHHFTTAGESAQGTNAARRDRFNWGIRTIIDEAVGLGLWVVPVDAKSILWDTALLDTDGVHPINTGNAALVPAWVAAIDGAQSYYKKRLSQISSGAWSDTLGSEVHTEGRPVVKNFRRAVVPRSQVGSGFSAHNNSATQGVNNSSLTQVGFSTELYDVNGDYASNAWTPPAGQVVIRTSVTFTAAVNASIYELYLYKNGVALKRLARVAANGTSELQVAGEAYDLAADGDAYTVYAFQSSGASATIDGGVTKTYFMGYSAS